MTEAAEELEFERAARLRDQLASVRKAIERQQMVGAKEEDYDAIGLAEDELEASVQVFFVRRGRVVGRKGFVVDKVEDLDTPALAARILEQMYGDATPEDVPKEVLVPRRARGPRALRRVPDPRARQQGAHPGAEAGQQAELPRDRDQERRGGLQPAPAQAGLRPQRAGPGPHRPPGGPGSSRGPAAHRVLRHLQHAGHRDRRVDGRHGGRAAEAVRLPPLQDPHPRRPGRLRGDGRGPHPPVPPTTSGSGTRGPGPGSGSPTRRTCS